MWCEGTEFGGGKEYAVEEEQRGERGRVEGYVVEDGRGGGHRGGV